MVALGKRAAKRLAEAVGEGRTAAYGEVGQGSPPPAAALTIAWFLREIEVGKRRIVGGLLVIDETSMVDLPTLYRIVRAIPSTMDLLFIGDPAQLPSVGPGLLYHRMVGCEAIPQVELDRVHRQAHDTGIPVLAGEIRRGCLPDLRDFDPSVPLAPGIFLARGAAPPARTRSTPPSRRAGPRDEETVRRWFARYLAEGVEGLSDAPRSGAPPKATAEYRERLLQVARCRPRALG